MQREELYAAQSCTSADVLEPGDRRLASHDFVRSSDSRGNPRVIRFEDIVRFRELVRCAAVLDRHAWALLRRLTRWLDQFKDCFGHRAQHVSLRQYIDGLLGDSPRKSMSAMLARVTEPTSYQAFQHFITHAPWDAEVVWRRLRARLPERTGILILDETSFPK